MSGIERLQAWVDKERQRGLVDIKFFPMDEGSAETMARAVVETLDGTRPRRPLDVAELDRIAGGIVDALENEADAVDITNDPL